MTQQTETVMVEDLNTFVSVLTGWHTNKVAALRHMQEIPAGTEIAFDDEDNKILDGELLKGFKMGIELALMELGTLPFFAEAEEPAL